MKVEYDTWRRSENVLIEMLCEQQKQGIQLSE